MTPNNNNYATQLQISGYNDRTYILGDRTMQGNLYGRDSVRQAIKHILSCERYSNPIYSDNYGVELEQYIGKSVSYLEATIEDVLRDALKQDDRVENVTVTSIESSLDGCKVAFNVSTVYGKIQEEVIIVQ